METEEMPLTKRAERLKVNGGTVLRTRMNIDDYAPESGAALSKFRQAKASGPRNYF